MITKVPGAGVQKSISHETTTMFAVPRNAADAADLSAKATSRIAADSLAAASTQPAGRSRLTFAQAQDVLARHIDDKLSVGANTAMIASGVKWRSSEIVDELGKAKRARGDLSPVTIDDISRRNMRELHTKLKAPRPGAAGGSALDLSERAFLERGLQKTYYATHFTDADLVHPQTGTMRLDSRQRLRNAKKAFAEDHVDDVEIQHMKNDNHTFFALEPGEAPQKFTSRFGKNVYRVPLDAPEFAHAFGAHRDPLMQEYPETRGRFKQLPAGDHAQLAERQFSVQYDPAQDVFSRKHLIPSILMRHVVDARELSPAGHKRLMEARTDADYNRTINGLLRPQILNPRATYMPEGAFKYYAEPKPTDDRA